MRLIVPAGLSVVLLIACHPTVTDPRTQAPLVLTANAVPAAPSELRLTGVVRARVESDLGFRVAGKVAARLVDAGQAVKKGQALMRLDPNDLALGASSRAFDLAATRARLDQTEADLKRLKGLVEVGATSAKSYDEATAAAAGARAQWAAAQSQSSVASNARGYSLLVADSDGVVQETMAEPGQIVSAGQPVIKLAQAGPREAAVDLPENYRPHLRSAGRASLYGGDGAVFPAVLRQVSQAADPLTRTYPARYVMQDAGAAAPLGTTVTLRLDGLDHNGPPTGARSAVSIPLGALYDSGTGAGVWLIGDDRVRFAPVTIVSLGAELAIVDGLAPGARIVALGADRLREGQAIRIGTTPSSLETRKAVP